MTITMRQVGPCFAAEADGVDQTRPLPREEVDAIHAGMDRYTVLVFHDQRISNEQQPRRAGMHGRGIVSAAEQRAAPDSPRPRCDPSSCAR